MSSGINTMATIHGFSALGYEIARAWVDHVWTSGTGFDAAFKLYGVTFDHGTSSSGNSRGADEAAEQRLFAVGRALSPLVRAEVAVSFVRKNHLAHGGLARIEVRIAACRGYYGSSDVVVHDDGDVRIRVETGRDYALDRDVLTIPHDCQVAFVVARNRWHLHGTRMIEHPCRDSDLDAARALVHSLRSA